MPLTVTTGTTEDTRASFTYCRVLGASPCGPGGPGMSPRRTSSDRLTPVGPSAGGREGSPSPRPHLQASVFPCWHENVESNFIYRNQKLEPIQTPVRRRADRPRGAEARIRYPAAITGRRLKPGGLGRFPGRRAGGRGLPTVLSSSAHRYGCSDAHSLPRF